jgi:hypothetical protein
MPHHTTTSSAAASSTAANHNNSSSGPTSSPLLFFVALGFGVVFTNLWYALGTIHSSSAYIVSNVEPGAFANSIVTAGLSSESNTASDIISEIDKHEH